MITVQIYFGFENGFNFLDVWVLVRKRFTFISGLKTIKNCLWSEFGF